MTNALGPHVGLAPGIWLPASHSGYDNAQHGLSSFVADHGSC